MRDHDMTADDQQAAIEGARRQIRDLARETISDLCCVTLADDACQECSNALLYLHDKAQRAEGLQQRDFHQQITIAGLRRRLAAYELSAGVVDRMRRTARAVAENVGLPPGALTGADVLDNLMTAVHDRDMAAAALASSRLLLLKIMSEISEDAYCAGWLTGLSRCLYRCVEEQSTRFGQGFEREQLLTLTATQVLAGGWWVWDLDAGETEPLFREGWTPDA